VLAHARASAERKATKAVAKNAFRLPKTEAEIEKAQRKKERRKALRAERRAAAEAAAQAAKDRAATGADGLEPWATSRRGFNRLR
jgi:hypothetical protein